MVTRVASGSVDRLDEKEEESTTDVVATSAVLSTGTVVVVAVTVGGVKVNGVSNIVVVDVVVVAAVALLVGSTVVVVTCREGVEVDEGAPLPSRSSPLISVPLSPGTTPLSSGPPLSSGSSPLSAPPLPGHGGAVAANVEEARSSRTTAQAARRRERWEHRTLLMVLRT